MIKVLLLLVIALAIFDGGDAVSKIETSKLSSSNVGHAVRTDNGGKRSLRGLALINDAANEERGGTEVANKLKALASESEVGQKLLSLAHKGGWDKAAMKTRSAKKVSLAKRLIDEDVPYKTLFKKNITPAQYFEATGFDIGLRFAGRRENILKSNPGFEKWLGYEEYWNEKMSKLAARNRGD